MKLRYFTIAMAVLFSLAVALYVTAPVEQLRTAAAYRPDGSGEDRVAGLAVVENLRLSEIPEMFLLGLLFREDKKFFEHRGFDFEEITNSIRDYLFRGRPLRGASTISQQLARTLLLNRERSLRRKLVEAVYTVKLERHFSKDEILVLHVSNIEWGVGIYGLRQAAEHYFGKSPSDLSDPESAFLVSIIPNPRRLSRTSYPGPLYMTCRLALSLQTFEDTVLQPTAIRYFGQPVVQMKELGVRNCRTVDGYQELLSEHAFANAIDVSSFVLRNGTVIDVAKDWNGASLQSAFLWEVASDACKVFRTVLTPGFDDRHDDHLHFDMALIGSCRASRPVPRDAH